MRLKGEVIAELNSAVIQKWISSSLGSFSLNINQAFVLGSGKPSGNRSCPRMWCGIGAIRRLAGLAQRAGMGITFRSKYPGALSPLTLETPPRVRDYS